MTLLPSAIPPFGVTHPLGLPRPIDAGNFFGARVEYFARNVMPLPAGCLAYFDGAVYRPYVEGVVEFLNGMRFGWSGPETIYDPPRYCLLRDGLPSHVPLDLRHFLPEPPRVPLEAVLRHLDQHHIAAAPLQILDVLTLVSEDIGPAKFASATASRPWVAELMR